MAALFLKLINMSINASWLVLSVILFRIIFKKAPRWIMVVLWGFVGIRLLFPISITSTFSMLPTEETIPQSILLANNPQINSGVPLINQVINPVISENFTPDPTASVNPLQVYAAIAAGVWIIGMISMLVYTFISYGRVKKRVTESIPIGEEVFICDNISTPFILGIWKPCIYLPSSLNEEDVNHVVAHERAHLKRRDHIWKPLGFLLLTVYWFNPILWVAYILLCRDIELACDEKVIRELGTDMKAQYSEALINCSVPRKMIASCPLAFGEVGVKMRVKNILNYKKPAFWLIAFALVACAAAGVMFLTNPMEYLNLDTSNGLKVYATRWAPGDDFEYYLQTQKVDYLEFMEAISPRNPKWKAVDAEEMKRILATYDIPSYMIEVVALKNPFSSYMVFGTEGLRYRAEQALGLEWIDIETATKPDDIVLGEMIIKWVNDDYFVAVPAEESPYVIRMNGTLSEEWKIGDYVECTYDNLRYDEEKQHIEANLISVKRGASQISSNPSQEECEQMSSEDLQAIIASYPHFLELDATDGLKIYVTCKGGAEYSYYLTDKIIENPDMELWSLQAADTADMKIILEYYDLQDYMVEVIPFQFGFSSFMITDIEGMKSNAESKLGVN